MPPSRRQFGPPNMRAVQNRLGMNTTDQNGQADPRGPQGMFSRGSNIYRGGLPNAQMGTGNPNIGRPPTAGMNSGIGQLNVPLSTYVGSLPPNQGNPDSTYNDALLALWRNRLAQNPGVA